MQRGYACKLYVCSFDVWPGERNRHMDNNDYDNDNDQELGQSQRPDPNQDPNEIKNKLIFFVVAIALIGVIKIVMGL